MIQMKKTIAAAAIAAASINGAQSTTLGQGDLAFTAFGGSSSTWGFSFLSFVDLTAGTTIYFTDNNIKADKTFNSTTESSFTWTWNGASDLAAGTVITVKSDKTVTQGSFVDLTSTTAWNHNGSTETLWAYMPVAGSTTTPAPVGTTLAAITMRTSVNTADNPAGTNLKTIDASLIDAGNDGGVRWAQFDHINDGTQYASATALRLAIADPSNWTSTATQNGAVLAVNSVSLITPVPEVSTYAMLLAGLGMIGVMARRRTND